MCCWLVCFGLVIVFWGFSLRIEFAVGVVRLGWLFCSILLGLNCLLGLFGLLVFCYRWVL